MKNLIRLFPLFALLAGMIGCGGGSSVPLSATVSGRVTDIDGLPVRGATVYVDNISTVTTSNGTFILNAVRATDIIVKAELIDGNTTYRGQNLARAFDAGQTMSVNIMIAPVTQLARLRGTVEDRFGNLLQGAGVFAFGAGALSSSRAITDGNGRFIIDSLIAGVDYTINAGGGGYGSDGDVVALSAGETGNIRLILSGAGFPNLPAPSNLTALVWTSPPVFRGQSQARAIEQVKRLFDPKRATRKPGGRLTTLGNPIEVELEWTPLTGDDLLGYNIYRGAGLAETESIYFWREPIGGLFIDSDENLQANQLYRYEITALGTRYPDEPNSEGPFSDLVEARTLGDLVLDGIDFDPLVFRYKGGSGATEYVVFLFNRFPDLGVNSIWNNAANPSPDLAIQYTGGPLAEGETYYYLVLGLANGQNSRTLSEVGSFVYSN